MMMTRCRILAMPAAILLLSLGLQSCATAEIRQMQTLQQQIKQETGIRRRQAVRQLLELGPAANPLIAPLLQDSDLVVRRNAYRNLRQRFGDQALDYYEKGLQDASSLVRTVVTEDLIAWEPRDARVTALLRKAADDPENDVRSLAANAFWNFHRNYIPLRKRPQWDHDITTLHQEPLPLAGWRFQTDPGRIGHVEKWFATNFDDSAWHATEIGKCWHEALPDKVGHYEGVAWYRLDFTAPAAPAAEYNEALLHFQAVDESTWVWVNGHYAGELDLGTSGWNVPFDIEVGSLLKWGKKNQITVRVLNAAGAGGIYKPVEFQILK